MVPTYEMFTSRHQGYGLPQNYPHYPDTTNFSSCNLESANNNYQQNFQTSWSLYSGRQHVLVEDWMHPCNYQNHHPSADTTTNYPFQQQPHSPADYSKVEQSEPPLEHSDTVVVVSSDGMSGSDSPILPLHVHQGSNGNTLFRPQPARSPFEWIKRSSCPPSQPNPGRTRTKDKYRVVYNDHQRLELEKEYHYSHYITIRRKVELATSLNLSERQIKIWFQNRRAKERRQNKKREELIQKSKDSQVVYQQATLNLGNLNIY